MGVLGYSTLFVDMERPDVRINGALATILVQAAWVNIISSDLPTTSDLKLIDFWITWHLAQNFLVIMYHIFLDKMATVFRLVHKAHIEPLDSRMIPNDLPITRINPMIANLNTFGMTILALANGLFYGIYFSKSLGKM